MLDVDIKKSLPGFELNVAFSAPNAIVALFGPSGTGKTMTLQIIAGLLPADRGRVLINGRPVLDTRACINLPARLRRVGYVPQSYALFPHLSVADNIGYSLSRLPAGERRQRVDELVTTMRLSGLEQRRPGELSGGQQQRVALARALITQPDILLLDEPFASLDSPIRARLADELLELHHRFPITVLLVSHELAEAYALSSKLVVMDMGSVLQEGDRETVLRHPVSRTAARFVSMRNFLDGQVEAVEEDGVLVRWLGYLLPAPPQPGLCTGDVATVTVRPEDVEVVERGRETLPGEVLLPATVVRVIDRGATVLAFVRVDGSPETYDFEVTMATRAYREVGGCPGCAVGLVLRRESVHVLTGAQAHSSRPPWRR